MRTGTRRDLQPDDRAVPASMRPARCGPELSSTTNTRSCACRFNAAGPGRTGTRQHDPLLASGVPASNEAGPGRTGTRQHDVHRLRGVLDASMRPARGGPELLVRNNEHAESAVLQMRPARGGPELSGTSGGSSEPTSFNEGRPGADRNSIPNFSAVLVHPGLQMRPALGRTGTPPPSAASAGCLDLASMRPARGGPELPCVLSGPSLNMMLQ